MQKEQNLKDKKILYLITQTKWGGAQKYVLELARYFGQDNEVHVAYGEINDLDSNFLETCQKLNIKTIPVPYLMRNIDLGREYLAIIEISKILRQGQYNLLHLNSSKAGLVGALAAKFYNSNPINIRMRIVYTAHGFVFNEPLSKLRKKIYKLSETISTGLENIIIAVSEADRQSAINNKITIPEKIFTVHNGLDPAEYMFCDKETAKHKLGLKSDKKYFGTIASFYQTKGYPYLVEAIKMLRDQGSRLVDNHGWVFIGDGPELEKIKTLVADNDLGKLIKFISQTKDAYQYLKAFDFFVLPSVKEGLPYTILEAGLAGVPTIASRVGGIPEILTDEQTGLLTTPANPLSLAQAMEKIANQTELARQLADNNYKNITTNFSLKQTLVKTEELYWKLF